LEDDIQVLKSFVTNGGDGPKQTSWSKRKHQVFHFHKEWAQIKNKQLAGQQFYRSKKNPNQNQNFKQSSFPKSTRNLACKFSLFEPRRTSLIRI